MLCQVKQFDIFAVPAEVEIFIIMMGEMKPMMKQEGQQRTGNFDSKPRL